ncbi:MAG: hypothetical protein JNL97_06180 [Verrucomicrobiales bacterium]|nr:hypothetical protein [Verrucomicrobiales bacterium]
MNTQLLRLAGRRAVRSLIALALAGVVFEPRAMAQANGNPPERMTYQGYVVDANGNPLGATNPKNYDIVFRIWNDAASTSAANRLWTEQQTVIVDKGFFSVLLGEGANIGEPKPALSTLFTNATASDRWVGITVKGIGAGTPPADVDIQPRIRLLTSPYAYLAAKAVSVDGGALVSGTVADARLSANVALRAGGNTFTSNQVFQANVGIGFTAPTNRLQVNGTAQVGYLNIQAGDGGNEGGEMFLQGAGVNSSWHVDNFAGRIRMFSPGKGEHFSLLDNGRLGLGTTSPSDRLHVAGTARVQYLTVDATDQVSEGGEITLAGAGTSPSWVMDVKSDRWRLFHGASERFSVNTAGNVGVGTTAPLGRLDVNGDLRIKGERPIAFKVFTGTGSITVDTGWPTNKYVASIAGFHADTGDIQEGGAGGTLIKIRAVPGNPNWKIEAEFRTHFDDEDWTITAMRVVRDLVTEDSTY